MIVYALQDYTGLTGDNHSRNLWLLLLLLIYGRWLGHLPVVFTLTLLAGSLPHIQSDALYALAFHYVDSQGYKFSSLRAAL